MATTDENISTGEPLDDVTVQNAARTIQVRPSLCVKAQD